MSTLRADYAPTANRILNALPTEEYDRLAPHLEHVGLARGEVLYRPEEPITHLYFPQRGTVSVVSVFTSRWGWWATKGCSA